MPPDNFVEWLLCGFLGMACISGIQLLISLVVRSFVIPVGISFLGAAAGLVAAAKFKQPYILPYSLLAIGMRSNNPEYSLNYKAFFISCTVQLFLWATLAILYINHTDIKTDEN